MIQQFGMTQVYKTETRSDAGTWRGGVHIIVENTGSGSATVGGKALSAGSSVVLTAVNVGDAIQFDYDATSSDLEITAGFRRN